MLGGCCVVKEERKKLYCCKVSALYRQTVNKITILAETSSPTRVVRVLPCCECDVERGTHHWMLHRLNPFTRLLGTWHDRAYGCLLSLHRSSIVIQGS